MDQEAKDIEWANQNCNRLQLAEFEKLFDELINDPNARPIIMEFAGSKSFDEFISSKRESIFGNQTLYAVQDSLLKTTEIFENKGAINGEKSFNVQDQIFQIGFSRDEYDVIKQGKKPIKSESKSIQENHTEIKNELVKIAKIIEDYNATVPENEKIKYAVAGALAGYLQLKDEQGQPLGIDGLLRYHGDIDICMSPPDIQKLKEIVKNRPELGLVYESHEVGHQDCFVKNPGDTFHIGFVPWGNSYDKKTGEYVQTAYIGDENTQGPAETIKIEHRSRTIDLEQRHTASVEIDCIPVHCMSIEYVHELKKLCARGKDHYDMPIWENNLPHLLEKQNDPEIQVSFKSAVEEKDMTDGQIKHLEKLENLMKQ